MNVSGLKKRSIAIASTGLLVASASEILRNQLFANPDELSGTAALGEIGLRLIRDIGWIAASSVMLVSGIWLLRQIGLCLASVVRFSLGLFGFAVPMGMAFLFIHGASKFDSMVSISHDFEARARTAMTDQSMDVKKRAMLTRMIAGDEWWRTGNRIKHIDNLGAAVVFAPSEIEIRQREEYLRARVIFESVKTGMERAIIIYGTILAMCAAIGLLSPRTWIEIED